MKKPDDKLHIDYLVDEIYNTYAKDHDVDLWEIEIPDQFIEKFRNLVNSNNIKELEVMAGKAK
jgi:hypothetical protein